MPTNLTDPIPLVLWLSAIVAGTLSWRRVAAFQRLHRILSRRDALGYSIIAAYCFGGLYWGCSFALKYHFNCAAQDCGFTLTRMAERVILWPYYGWHGLV